MPAYRGRREADLAASPEACFAALTDYGSMPDWQRALRSVTVTEPGDGWDVVTFEVDAKVRSFRYTLRLRYEPPRLIDSDYVDGPFRDFGARWTFDPAPGGGTRAAVEVRLDPGRLIPRPVTRIVEDALLGRAIDDLRARVDGPERG
jgi:ribosome-associated toxin RatA of RatAB toxin-antitoxin module